MMLRYSVRTSFSCAPFPVRQNAVPPKLDLKCSYNSTDDYKTCLSLFFPHKLDSILCSFLSPVIFFHYFPKQKSFVEFRCRRCRTHSSKKTPSARLRSFLHHTSLESWASCAAAAAAAYSAPLPPLPLLLAGANKGPKYRHVDLGKKKRKKLALAGQKNFLLSFE